MDDFGELVNYWPLVCSALSCACCCVPITQKLTLGPEEAVLKTGTMIGSATQRRPYGELGSVDIAQNCGCCWAVTSGLGVISPGFGCEEETVKKIHAELKR